MNTKRSIKRGLSIKTDPEIKQWIDSREVVTKSELSQFIYGYNSTNTQKVNRYWLYVLDTKDLAKLKKYAYDKETHNDRLNPILERIAGIYRTDPRFNSLGGKASYKLFNRLYGVDCNERTFQKYHKKVKYELV